MCRNDRLHPSHIAIQCAKHGGSVNPSLVFFKFEIRVSNLTWPFKPWLNTVFFLGSIVDSIPACHAGDRGSIARRGERMILSYATSGCLQSKGSETCKAACSNITKTEKMTWRGSSPKPQHIQHIQSPHNPLDKNPPLSGNRPYNRLMNF